MPHEFGRYTDMRWRKKGDAYHEETRREAADAAMGRDAIEEIQRQAAENDKKDLGDETSAPAVKEGC